MKLKIAGSALVLALVTATGVPLGAQQYQGPAQDRGYDRGQGNWDAPPQEFSDVQRQGFRDGMEAARRDAHDGREGGPEHHREFRNPQVPQPSRHDYREAFRRGYGTAMRHMRDHPDGGPR